MEWLEDRIDFAADFHNTFNEFDIDDDGYSVPQDALLVIQELIDGGARNLSSSSGSEGRFVDVDGDDYLTPLDALLVINHLSRVGDEPLALVVGLTPDTDPDGNGVVLRSAISVSGQSTPDSRLRLTRTGGSPMLVTADSSGRFQFDLEIPPGTSSFLVTAVDSERRSSVVEGTVRFGDVILDWNASMLNVVRDWTTLSNDPYPNRIVTSQPPMVARNLAMVHAAMYDAVNAVECTHESLHVNLVAPGGASTIAAAAAAAHRVASSLYQEPDERAVFDAALAEALDTVPDGPDKTAGIEFGNQVGDAILEWRNNDGASTKVTYTPGTNPGDWQRTFPGYYPPTLPQWPQVTPFAIASGSEYRAAPPPALDSPEYAAAVDEVMRLGSLNSTERTAEQTEIALFWSDGGGTSTPPGHWNQIAADVAIARGSGMAENARLFALLNVAMADASIASWDAKYAYNLWRPIDAIQHADLDENEATFQDSDWIPLIVTPPFPSYTSGHSTFSGAADAVLTAIYGANVHFSGQSDGHTGFTQRPLASEQIVMRSFASFSEAAEEAGRSRIYGGIHYEFDSVAGLDIGRAIGNFVMTHLLRERE